MKVLTILLTLLIINTGSTVYAAKQGIVSKITTVLIDGKNFGGCMAKLEDTFASKGVTLQCKESWVSFGCDGEFNSKDVAYHMYDSAQMSLALDLSVYIYIDDTKKYGDYCVAQRIDVKK